MSFTRLYNDPSITRDHVKQSTFAGKYALNTPGPGIQLPFMEDPNIRLQKWGANMMSNTVNIENDLKGMTRILNRDYIEKNNYMALATRGNLESYPVEKCFVDETRNSNPAWSLRCIDNIRWDFPIVNPQANLEKTFHNNIQTRILEKDNYDFSYQKRMFIHH